MATNYVQPGEVVTVVAPAGGTTSNAPVLVGSIFGVATTTELVGVDCEVAIEGTWNLTKEAPLVISEGDPVFWDDTAAEVNISGVGLPIGIATAAALSAAVLVEVKLIPGANTGQDYALNGKFRAVYDATAGLAIGDHAFGPFLPDNARVTGAVIVVTTTFTSATDAASIGVGFDTDDVSGIVAPVTIVAAANWDAGVQATIQDAGTAAVISEQLTARRQFEAVVAVEALTAGVFVLFGDYIVAS